MPIKISENDIIEAFEKSDDRIKDVLELEGSYDSIENIANDYKINDEDMNSLMFYVMAVLLRFLPVDKFPEEIKNALNINDNDAEKLAKEITQEVFTPVEKYLTHKEIAEKKEEDLQKPADMSSQTAGPTKQAREEKAPAPSQPVSDIVHKESKRKEEITKPNDTPQKTGGEPKPAHITKENHTPKPTSQHQNVKKETKKEYAKPDIDDKGSDPFVIRKKENKKAPEAKGVQRKKGFSFSLGKVFSQDSNPSKKKAPRAKVETPQEKKGKEEAKVVHYSEHRSEPDIVSSPKEPNKNNSNISAQNPSAPELKDVPQKMPDIKTEHSGMPGSPKDTENNKDESKNGPKLKGNEVDLSN